MRKGDRIELVELDDGFGDGSFMGRHIAHGVSGLFPQESVHWPGRVQDRDDESTNDIGPRTSQPYLDPTLREPSRGSAATVSVSGEARGIITRPKPDFASAAEASLASIHEKTASNRSSRPRETARSTSSEPAIMIRHPRRTIRYDLGMSMHSGMSEDEIRRLAQK